MLIDRGLGQEDPFVRIYAASFLVLDRAGDPKENRRLAVAQWLEAARRDGEPNRYLAEEFQLSLAAPHEAEDQPAPMDR